VVGPAAITSNAGDYSDHHSTTNQTVEWTSGEVVNTFNPFEVDFQGRLYDAVEVRCGVSRLSRKTRLSWSRKLAVSSV